MNKRHTIIASVHNTQIKAARLLHQARERKTQGKLLIEGYRHISEALAAGAAVRQCFYLEPAEEGTAAKDILAKLAEVGVELIPVSDRVLAALADTATPQGMVAVAQLPEAAGPAVLCRRQLLLVADEVRDPGNLGTMLRTAAAVGAGVVLTAGCADYTQPKVVRSSAGAIYSVPIWAGANVLAIAEQLRQAGFRIYVCDAAGDTSHFQADFSGKTAVVIGNEGHGPAPCWHGAGARIIYIPMPGRAESLNAAISAAVVLYEAVRQRYTRQHSP